MPEPSALVLIALTTLFFARVLGQTLVAFAGVTWLPPMEAWHSGLLAYPVLLPVQVLILLLQVKLDIDASGATGLFAKPRPALGDVLGAVSYAYAVTMIVRYVVTRVHAIPVVFHLVLTAYLFVLGRLASGERPGARVAPRAAVDPGHRALRLGDDVRLYRRLRRARAEARRARARGRRRDHRAGRRDGDLRRRPPGRGRLPSGPAGAGPGDPGSHPVFEDTRHAAVRHDSESDMDRAWLCRRRAGHAWSVRVGRSSPSVPGRATRRHRDAAMACATAVVRRSSRHVGRLVLRVHAVGACRPGRARALGAADPALQQRPPSHVLPGGRVRARERAVLGVAEPGRRRRSAGYRHDRAWRPGLSVARRGRPRSPTCRSSTTGWITPTATSTGWTSTASNGPERLRAPALLMAGWLDPFLPGQLDDFVRIRRGASREVAQASRLIIGPWAHAETVRLPSGLTPPNYRLESLGPSVAWFDRHLRPGTAPPRATAPVRLFVMGENVWRDEHEWPLARTRYTALYLRSSGRANTAHGDGELTFAPPVAPDPPPTAMPMIPAIPCRPPAGR